MSSAEKGNLMRAMFARAVQAADPDQFMPEAIRKLLPDHMDGPPVHYRFWQSFCGDGPFCRNPSA